MPTYEYGCSVCQHQWELEQRISENAIKKCPKCGKRKAQRLISGGGAFILKGGGWEADLYGSPAPKKKKKKEESSSSDSSSSDSSSSDSSSSDSGSSDSGSSDSGTKKPAAKKDKKPKKTKPASDS